MNDLITASIILYRIKTEKNLKRETDLANYLGVKLNVLSNWRKRNTFDFEVIYNKCKEDNISLDWLFDLNNETYNYIKQLNSIIASQQKTIEKLTNKL